MNDLPDPGRRQFLSGLTALAFTPPGLRGAVYHPTLASQTYIWILEMQARNKPLSEALEEIFATTRRAGFHQVELMSEFVKPEIRDRTFALVKKHRLDPVIIYAGGPLHDRRTAGQTTERVLELARMNHPAGVRAINFNPDPKNGGQRKSDEELAVQAELLNELGEELQRLGTNLFLHHHLPEMRENAREWRYDLAHTHPRLVEFCIDLDWAFRGGQDPLTLIRAAEGRLGSIHIRNSRKGVFMETVDEGDIDMAPIAAFLRQMQFTGYLVVELARGNNTKLTHPLFDDLKHAHFYTQKVFGSRPGLLQVNM
jgi:sugar phosphate isomerase/epimerase